MGSSLFSLAMYRFVLDTGQLQETRATLQVCQATT